MSSRVLRKLQAENDLNSRNSDEEDDDQFNVVPSKSNKKKKPTVNPFDLLNENGSISEEEADERDDADERDIMQNGGTNNQDSTKNITSIITSTEEAMPRQAVAAKKKKKKKRKGKGKEGQDQKQQSDNKMDEEDIDATIREVNSMLGIGTTVSTTFASSSVDGAPGSLCTKALLGVEHRNLNAENEMKKRFGTNIVRTENRQRKAHRRVYHRSTWLVSPKETWPNMSKSGLSMALLESKNGYNYFAFEHSQTYQNIQFQFMDAVESLDPNNISAILHSHPFHVDSLLQLSEVCKMGEDYQMAAELIERSLYCFECSFHTLFSLAQGTSRLDYKRAENRPFFIALFRHLNYVGQRGCHRTALELCKLLLSLDPDSDPLCVLLMIDFYALTSDQYSFLVRLYEEWESHRNLSQLPNFAYSVPLALFHLNKTGEKSKADEMIQNALIMFPSVLVPLMDKCNVVLDSSIANHKFFSALTISSQSMALKQLVMLYVGRAFHVWKDPEVIDWLVCNVKRVIERVDGNDPYVEECARRRRVRYQGTPRNIYRHIIMSDIKDATASLPMELSDIPMMSYDPLPPVDSISSYAARPQRRTVSSEEGNPLTMFFRSLLPSFNPQAPSDPHQEVVYEDQEPVGAEGGPRPLRGTDLAQGVEHLMSAMRELLNTMTYRGEPENEPRQEGEQDWNEEERDDGANR